MYQVYFPINFKFLICSSHDLNIIHLKSTKAFDLNINKNKYFVKVFITWPFLWRIYCVHEQILKIKGQYKPNHHVSSHACDGHAYITIVHVLYYRFEILKNLGYLLKGIWKFKEWIWLWKGILKESKKQNIEQRIKKEGF